MKTDDELLEQYYHENSFGDKPFKELSTQDKELFRGLWGFAFFKASEAWKEFKAALKESINKSLPHN